MQLPCFTPSTSSQSTKLWLCNHAASLFHSINLVPVHLALTLEPCSFPVSLHQPHPSPPSSDSPLPTPVCHIVFLCWFFALTAVTLSFPAWNLPTTSQLSHIEFEKISQVTLWSWPAVRTSGLSWPDTCISCFWCIFSFLPVERFVIDASTVDFREPQQDSPVACLWGRPSRVSSRTLSPSFTY